MRRHRHPDSGHYGTYRAHRRPFRGQYLGVPGSHGQREGEGDHRGVFQTAGEGTACDRPDQHPVYRHGRRGVCDWGESAFFPDRTLYQQGDGNPDRGSCHGSDHREKNPGSGLWTGAAAGGGLLRREDAGLFLWEDPRRGDQPGAGDEIHGRMPGDSQDL